MTVRMALSNITSFALQVTVLVAAGAALARAFRIDEPRAMLAYWRTLLAACLALPLCQPWNIVIPPALAPATLAAADSAAVEVGQLMPAASRSTVWPIADLVLIALAAGIAARALWLTIGAFALRRLRRCASPLDPLPECVRQAQERTGARAGMYVSDLVSSPITFGVLRPVVVFPPSVSTMPEHVQEAIACHELIHVRRRDWIYEILEEAVRSVLWFHPAVWWLIGRIRLTREQVVDQAVIRLTESKERYVESLLAVALAGSPAAFAPASSFLRRHLLKKRVARILQESTMTTRRLIASLTASAAALALAATLAVRSFPLEAQGRAPADTGEPVQLVKGGEHLLHGETPHYPRRAIVQKVQGDVVVEMTLDERGEVSDARVVSGPDELRKAALEAVLTWHYSPSAISSTVTHATLRFHLPPAGFEKHLWDEREATDGEKGQLRAWAVERPEAEKLAWSEVEKPFQIDDYQFEYKAKHRDWEITHPELGIITEKIHSIQVDGIAGGVPGGVPDGVAGGVPGGVAGGVAGGVPGGVPGEIRGADVEIVGPGYVLSGKQLVLRIEAEERLALFDGAPPLAGVRTERVPESWAKEVLAQAGVAIGDAISEDTAKRIRQVARDIDEHFRVEFHKDPAGLIITIVTR